ncbi:PLP-dependent aminotransferase family protein [Micromonospora sp. DT81.3]|uniref:MocR-like transcription factor YczR n=1 Tax=Micromonospora sp. DT81.3 TaxID=3416523 RepID=UPI003CF2DA61
MMDSRVSARTLENLLGPWRTREPAYEAIADSVRLLCLDNRLAPGTALPAERELAARLRVSRTTVAAAYRSLRDSGHIESHRGSGSVTLPLGGSAPGGFPASEGVVDLQQASPSAWPGLAAAYGDAAANAASLVSRTGYDVVGRPALREAIAAHYVERGLPTTASQIMVTNGAQSAIALVASLFVSRADRVVIETPTYPHAAEAFRRRGARLVGVPVVSGHGWDLERAEHAFRRAVPSAAYLMPDFQNPTGSTMTRDERVGFAEAARQAGATLIIDETTAELDIDRPRSSVPFASVAEAMGGVGLVTIGSLGKTVWGGLRIGWIRAEVDVIRRLVAARTAHDLGTPEFEQSVAEHLFRQMAEILAQRSGLLREGRDAAMAALALRMPEWDVPAVHGGVSLWVGLGEPLSSNLVMSARRRGLLLSAGPRFSVDGGHERHLRIPFTVSRHTIERAVDTLAEAWGDVSDGVAFEGTDSLSSVI